MSSIFSIKNRLAKLGIAALCFGYFATYVPFSMMTKMATKGLFEGMNGIGLTGLEIQPAAIFGGLIAMYAFIFWKGWWKYATQWNFFGLSLPRPRWFTLISGICTSGQIITTILAYTFSGVSIVFAMLLMRGGVLVMAPVVDLVARKRKRKIYWPSWVAAGLSLAALLVTFSSKTGTAMTIICAVDIALYLFGYFFRLFIMSNFAKSNDENEKIGFFTEEQTIAMPFLMVAMLLIAVFGIGDGRETVAGQFWYGFTGILSSGYFWHIAVMGVFSSGTGLFGTLIFLDKRENTFTVPANRASSIVAGVIATYALAIFWGERYPSTDQLVGVSLILVAIFFLAYRSIVEKRRKRQVASFQVPKKSVISMTPVAEAE
jgi:hypothetical protein